MINGVVVRTNSANHSDDRRDIIVVNNSSPDDIPTGQVKILKVHQEGGAWLGGSEGHYHEYMETYDVVGLEVVTFYLQSVKTGEKQTVELKQGQQLLIPAKVAHKVFAPCGAVLIGITEKPYISPKQDIPYAVEVS